MTTILKQSRFSSVGVTDSPTVQHAETGTVYVFPLDQQRRLLKPSTFDEFRAYANSPRWQNRYTFRFMIMDLQSSDLIYEIVREFDKPPTVLRGRVTNMVTNRQGERTDLDSQAHQMVGSLLDTVGVMEAALSSLKGFVFGSRKFMDSVFGGGSTWYTGADVYDRCLINLWRIYEETDQAFS